MRHSFVNQSLGMRSVLYMEIPSFHERHFLFPLLYCHSQMIEERWQDIESLARWYLELQWLKLSHFLHLPGLRLKTCFFTPFLHVPFVYLSLFLPNLNSCNFINSQRFDYGYIIILLSCRLVTFDPLQHDLNFSSVSLWVSLDSFSLWCFFSNIRGRLLAHGILFA